MLFVGQSAMLSALSQYSAAAEPASAHFESACSDFVSVELICWLRSVCCVQTRLGNDLHCYHSVTLEGIRNKAQPLIRCRFRREAHVV